MSKGDMEASLVSKGFSWEQASDIVRTVINCIDDPNFAQRYAQSEEPKNDSELNIFMCQYWDVVKFLKSLL